MSGLLVLGAGGHGRVVAFTARSTGRWSDVAFLDGRFPEISLVDGHPVLGGFDLAASLVDRYPEAVVALGDGRARLDLMKRVRECGFALPVIAHPSAVVSEHAAVGAGTVILAQCVLHPGAVLGEGCIVNTGATVDHDCVLGDGVHLSPGVHLGGQVRVGDLSWLGVGVSVKNGVAIGPRVVVGVGAAVVSDLPADVTAMGVPAQVTTAASETR